MEKEEQEIKTIQEFYSEHQLSKLHETNIAVTSISDIKYHFSKCYFFHEKQQKTPSEIRKEPCLLVVSKKPDHQFVVGYSLITDGFPKKKDKHPILAEAQISLNSFDDINCRDGKLVFTVDNISWVFSFEEDKELSKLWIDFLKPEGKKQKITLRNKEQTKMLQKVSKVEAINKKMEEYIRKLKKSIIKYENKNIEQEQQINKLKNTINELKLEKQEISGFFTQSEQTPNYRIKNLLSKISTERQILSNRQKKNQVVCLMGDTGSGKSTLINYFCRQKMMTFEKKCGRYLLSQNNSDEFPRIGDTNQSSSSDIKFYPFTDNICICDNPGLNDTRGVQNEIISSYNNAKMFYVGAKARIILLVDINSFQCQRGEFFVRLIQRFRSFFRLRFRQIINSCILIISKVNQYFYTLEDIIAQIKAIKSNNKKLDLDEIMFLNTLVKEERVLIFPTPETINKQTIEELQKKIQAVPIYVVDKQAEVSLSPQAIQYFFQIVTNIERRKQKIMKTIGKGFAPKFLKDLQNKEKMQQILLIFKEVKKMVEQKQLESGVQSTIDEIGQKLQVQKQLLNQYKQLLCQEKFCSTICFEIKSSTKISEILLIYISSIILTVELAIHKRENRQKIEKIKQQNQEQLQQQEQKYFKELNSFKNSQQNSYQTDDLQHFQKEEKTITQILESEKSEVRQQDIAREFEKQRIKAIKSGEMLLRTIQQEAFLQSMRKQQMRRAEQMRRRAEEMRRDKQMIRRAEEMIRIAGKEMRITEQMRRVEQMRRAEQMRRKDEQIKRKKQEEEFRANIPVEPKLKKKWWKQIF